MIRLLVHMAAPAPKREVAATMTGLSGNPEEFSVELNTIPGGASDLWDEQVGYPRPGKYWGASQAFSFEVCQAMQQSGEELGADVWYAAFDEVTQAYVTGNIPAEPVGSFFSAFLDVIGCTIVEPEYNPE